MSTALAVVAGRRRTKSPLVVAAGVVILVAVILAVVGTFITPYDPYAVDVQNFYAAPSTEHLVGTDDLGRDLLSRILVAFGPTLAGPAIVIAVATLIGTVLALCAAWFGGLCDAVISRCLDVMFSIPGLILSVLVVAIVGVGFSAPVMALSIAFVPWIARVLRGAAVNERKMAYIAALQVQGISARQICLRHLLPNIAPVIVAQACVGFGYALLDLATVSYLGLGVQPPNADLGLMIANGQPAILGGYPQQSIYAATLVGLIVVAVNLIGDALSARFEGSSR